VAFLKVPQITHIITGLDVGGAERALFTLLTNGLEGPFRNRVISLMGPGHYGPLLEAAGIPVTCLHMHPGRPSPGAALRLLASVRALPCDIVQGWMIHGNLAATFARRWGKREAALVWNQRLSLETLPDLSRLKRGLIRLEARLSKGPEAIIHNSARSRRQYAAHGYADARALHLPNGFDTDKWAPNADIRQRVRRELAIPDAARVIGYVGRGHPQKDLANLFGAFAKVAPTHSEAVLVAVGRGHEHYAAPSDRVRLLGQRGDVPDLMCGFDLLCLSSRAEGFPNVVGEAMASGVPCVTTDVGDARHIVGDTGWVAPPRDTDRLAACLDAALTCTPEALRARGARARARIVKDFSIASVVDRYIALYQSLARQTA
jgi:glycosyltransferase involved in cell wall biosynthesis